MRRLDSLALLFVWVAGSSPAMERFENSAALSGWIFYHSAASM